ncbi:MAG: prolipoprotein diacylglyceryl transferase [Anaerolineaceae bacterium]|nr:prolipoprotein diacylglyceryl transferase [Anaerolineaceae bacterium]
MEFERELIVLFDRVQLRYYGIILVVAMLVAANVAARLARRSGHDPEHIWGALTWGIIPAIVGARLWFVFFPPAALVDEGITTVWMLQNFFDMQQGAIAIWSGGLGIFGAVGGGLLGVLLYLRRNNLMPGPWLDIAAVALPVGQATGRWANFVNQELYGTPTDLPWGITIDASSRVAPYRSLIDYPLDTGFHPLFLYESLWSLLGFLVLLNLYRRWQRRLPGDIFIAYLAFYCAGRFLLEFIRVEVVLINTLNVNQTIVGLLFLLAVALLLYRRRGGEEAFAARLALAGEQERASRHAEEEMIAAREAAAERRRAQQQPLREVIRSRIARLRNRHD